MLEIVPLAGDAIDFFKLQSFLIDRLRGKYGFRVKKFTTDHYQGTQMRQAYQKLGVNAELFSVDRTDAPYLLLRDMFGYGCVDTYSYQPLIDNLLDLEHDLGRRKVDHTKSGRQGCV